ncbi:MAG TPA: MarR family transcriptional regulator [Rhizomicrobium sp.]|jgi:DNA-binding MarR family transcriptional regulator|nr:MarR family transcriptional regulator [Rhizomicrobium sp.]
MPRSNTKGLTAGNYRDLAEFRFLLRNFLAFSEKAARKAGLAPQQHQALLAVKGFPGDAPPSMGDLANRLGIRHHSAVGLVDRLVLAGWLRRTTDLEDGRKVSLSLTRAGEAKIAALSTVHREELRRLAPMLRELLAHIDR